MRYPEEFEVVIAEHVFVEIGEQFVDARRRLDGAQVERGFALQRHGGDDANRPEPDACHVKQFGLPLS